MDPEFKKYGDFIEYNILPEHKSIQLVAIKTTAEFHSLLKKYNAEKIVVDFEKLISGNDTNYSSLARIELATIYSLQNGLFLIDQEVNSLANPHFICASLDDYKLITKYLLIFRPEKNSKPEVKCSIHNHFEIKKFLERQRGELELLTKLSTDGYRYFLEKAGKAIYLRYTDKKTVTTQLVELLLGKLGDDSEDEFYWDIVIYESLEKMKRDNVDLEDQ